MNESAESPTTASWKEQKRQQKLAWKAEQQARKLARREEKLARRQARRSRKRVVATRTLADRARAVELVQQVLEGLKSGTVSLSDDGESLEVHVPEAVDLRLRVRQTWKSEGVTIRIRWPRSSDKGGEQPQPASPG